MAAKTIRGITVEIGGNTTGLGKALDSVNGQLKATQTELNKVDKALKLDPNNTTLLKQKQELLNESIKDTKSKLDALKSAQKQVQEQFKNNKIGKDAYRDFQRELETTKTKMNNLVEEHKKVKTASSAFSVAKDKVNEFASKTEKLRKVLSKTASGATKLATESAKIGAKTVTTSINIANKGLQAYAGTAVAAATAIAGITVSAGAAADDINTLSAQTGLSTDQIQKFQYASDLIDVDLNTLTGSMAKLTKNMGNAQKGTGDAKLAFDALGVSVTDNNGELRNNQDVFNDAITALGQMENSTQRDAYAMQIFGKSAQDLNPLILGGAEALEELGLQADGAGLILSTDALSNLNEFNDSVDILKANTSASGKVIGGAFAGSFKSFTDTIGQSIPLLASSMAGMFSPATFLESKVAFSANMVEMATSLITDLATNLPTFLNGFNGVILGVVDGIVATLPTIVTTILPTLISGFTDLVSGLVAQVPVVLPLLVEGGLVLFTGLLNSLNQITEQLMPMLPTLIEQITTMLIDNLPTIQKGGYDLLVGLITGITECIPQLIDTVVDLIPVMTQCVTDNLPALITAGIELIVALATGLPQAIPTVIKAIINSFKEQDWLQIGKDILSGIANGLIEGVKAIGSVISDVGSSIKDGFCDFFGIHSPSRMFRDVIGINLADGIGVGFEDEMKTVNDSMQKALPTSFDTNVDVGINKNQLSNANVGLNSAISSSMPQTAEFYFIFDGKVFAEATAPYIDMLQGATLKMSNRGLA